MKTFDFRLAVKPGPDRDTFWVGAENHEPLPEGHTPTGYVTREFAEEIAYRWNAYIPPIQPSLTCAPTPIDRRHQRAVHFASHLMNVLQDFLPPSGRIQQAIYDQLTDALHGAGVEVITDHDRKEAGLPPRGAFGLTQYELSALEARRLEILHRPMIWPTEATAGHSPKVEKDAL